MQEHHQARMMPEMPQILRDSVRWVLALFRLPEPPLLRLNPVYVQRLSKVLFCCMLRLPESQQQKRCAKAALALCWLCLHRFTGEQAQPTAALPLPQVDSRTLPKSLVLEARTQSFARCEAKAGSSKIDGAQSTDSAGASEQIEPKPRMSLPEGMEALYDWLKNGNAQV
jgi:hypothetical protein